MGAARNLVTLKLDEVLHAAVAESVVEVFKETFSIKVELVKYFTARNYIATGDVSGNVGLIQKRQEGNMVMSFTRQSLSNVLAKVYGEIIDSSSANANDLLKDGAAELTNIVYGRMKMRMSNSGFEFEIALPSVIVGQNHNINQVPKLESGVFVFQFGKNTFEVVVTVNSHES